MSVARKLKREKQIQERRALRAQLKDESVQNHIRREVDLECKRMSTQWAKFGFDIAINKITHAADDLTYGEGYDTTQ